MNPFLFSQIAISALEVAAVIMAALGCLIIWGMPIVNKGKSLDNDLVGGTLAMIALPFVAAILLLVIRAMLIANP